MIWEFLHPFFRWSDSTWIREAIRDSRYLFPVINTVHLLALTVLLGAISVMHLRLLGLVLPQETDKNAGGKYGALDVQKSDGHADHGLATACLGGQRNVIGRVRFS